MKSEKNTPATIKKAKSYTINSFFYKNNPNFAGQKSQLTMMRLMFVVALACAFAGEGRAQKKSFWRSVVAYMDSSNVKGVDPDYISQPEKPWALVLNSNTSQMNMNVTSTTYYDKEYWFTLDMQVKPPVTTSFGLWAGYRGWGAGYSLSLSGNKGYDFALNMVSPSYGINIRAHEFDFDDPRCTVSFNVPDEGKEIETTLDDELLGYVLNSPMKISSFVFDGYWVFNRRRFSLLAAYDQSTVQRRSAGSLIAGLMYYHQKLDYNSASNYFFISAADHVALMRVHQLSLGLGYTYNWVPARGLVVNAVAMPVLTLLNRVTSSHYNIAGEQLEHTGDETLNGGVKLNLDLRMAVSYGWGDWYIGVTGQGHRFRSNDDVTTIRLTDWTVKAFIGRRL